MKKALCIVSEDAVLKAKFAESDCALAEMKARLDFLTGKIKQLTDEFAEKKKPFWRGVEDHLRSIGKLPADYNPDTWNMSYKDKEDVLYCMSPDENRPSNPLAQLIKKLGMPDGMIVMPPDDL